MTGSKKFGLTRMAALAAVAVVLVATGGTLYIVSRGDSAFAQCNGGGVVAGEAAIGGPFELINTDGQTVTHETVMTRPSLVYFGFTNCPGVCPVDTARNVDAIVMLEEMGIEVTPVFISVDPARDTPDVLADYSGAFHERMVGLTGSMEQVRAAADQYRAYFQARPARDDGFYMVDHSTQTYLMLPGHGFATFYPRSSTPDEMAESIACYARAGGYA